MASLNAAAIRAADSLLRTVGGRQVLLRTPAPANPNDDGEQLGLTTPVFQDAAFGPVVFRRLRPKLSTGPNSLAEYELLASATAVNALIGTFSDQSAEALFATAFGVLLDDILMEIVSSTWSEIGGAPYLYRLLLRAPFALNT